MNITPVLTLIVAYLLGSLPTALIVSSLLAQTDIRHLGDGNMGARNTAHTLGWKAGWFVAGIDIAKGACSVGLAHALGLEPFWQVMAAFCAVLGHDFPIFAGFHGGQGLAATIGDFFVLVPLESLYGLIVFGVLYFLTRNFDISTGAGIALIVFQTWRLGEPPEFIIGEIAIVLLIPFKKLLDRHQNVTIPENTYIENGLPTANPKEANGFQK